MSSWSFVAAVLILLTTVATGVFIYRKRKGSRKRIKILPKERVRIDPAAVRRCPACGESLTNRESTARCSANSAHVIHQQCRTMVRGICPTCSNKLEELG